MLLLFTLSNTPYQDVAWLYVTLYATMLTVPPLPMLFVSPEGKCSPKKIELIKNKNK